MSLDLSAAIATVAPLIIEASDKAEQERNYPASVVQAMAGAGLMRMFVPAVYGGPEVAPAVALAAMEDVAAIDGAAGWLTMIASTTSSLAVFLEPAAAAELFGPANVVTGGVFAPNGRAVAVDGGWRCNGTWQWGSGTANCDWITGGCIADDGSMRLMFFHAADVTLHDTWHTHGLRGTGSGEFSVTDVVVAERHSFQPLANRPHVDSPLARFPNFTLLASGVAACTLGIARHALEEVMRLATEKRPQYSQRTLSQHAMALIELPRAWAAWGSARAFLHEQVEEIWSAVLAGSHVSIDSRVRLRLACINAAEQSTKAVDTAYTLAGGTSVFQSSPLQRCLRDVHVATQHVMVSPRVLETIGKVMSGQAADTSMF